ncbi:hypothetical protein GQR58_030464 [Nymphon striatum]|nr:hypothetical protein GQR58_030464 [Nymphon striatum]
MKPQLAHSRIREHLLDVVLGNRDRRSEQGSEQPDPGNQAGGPVVGLGQDWVDACQQVDAGGHHGGRVDQRRYRRWSSHGVGEPDVQRELCGLTRSAHEHQQGNGGGGAMGDLTGEHLAVLDAAIGEEGQEGRQHESEVANSVGDEGFLASGGIGFFGEPERDQEVGARTHAFPTKEGQQQVVAKYQHEHGEGEQVQVHEELGEVGIAVHVANRVQVDQRGHASDEQDHGDRKRIGQQANVDAEVTSNDPIEEFHFDDALFAMQLDHADKDHDRSGKRASHGCGGEPASNGFAETATEEEQSGEAQQGKQWNEPHEFNELFHDQPRSTDRSSAVAPGRRRVMATMIARPTTTSAAATTSTKNTEISPPMSLRSLPKVTNVRFTALSMSSTHMNMMSGFRRTSKPVAADRKQDRGKDQVPGRCEFHQASSLVASARSGSAPAAPGISGSGASSPRGLRANMTAPTTAMPRGLVVGQGFGGRVRCGGDRVDLLGNKRLGAGSSSVDGHRNEDDAQRQHARADNERGWTLPGYWFDRKVFGLVNTKQHDHEQEQHHDGAGVHDDLHRRQKLCVLVQEQHRNRQTVP